MKLLFTLVAIAALTAPALSVQAGRALAGERPSDSDSLKTMLAIKLEDLDGKPVAADKFKGSVVVLDFWATWCGPCIAEIPAYNRMQEKYADKGVKIVGVTMASGEAEEVKPFVARHKMKYTILMGDDAQAYDLNLMGFPTTYLVTKDWKVYRKYVGASPRKSEQLEADIRKLLGEQ
jgi:thiol-disulfide isomerase/thioredoxin